MLKKVERARLRGATAKDIWPGTTVLRVEPRVRGLLLVSFSSARSIPRSPAVQLRAFACVQLCRRGRPFVIRLMYIFHVGTWRSSNGYRAGPEYPALLDATQVSAAAEPGV